METVEKRLSVNIVLGKICTMESKFAHIRADFDTNMALSKIWDLGSNFDPAATSKITENLKAIDTIEKVSKHRGFESSPMKSRLVGC